MLGPALLGLGRRGPASVSTHFAGRMCSIGYQPRGTCGWLVAAPICVLDGLEQLRRASLLGAAVRGLGPQRIADFVVAWPVRAGRVELRRVTRSARRARPVGCVSKRESYPRRFAQVEVFRRSICRRTTQLSTRRLTRRITSAGTSLQARAARSAAASAVRCPMPSSGRRPAHPVSCRLRVGCCSSRPRRPTPARGSRGGGRRPLAVLEVDLLDDCLNRVNVREG